VGKLVVRKRVSFGKGKSLRTHNGYIGLKKKRLDGFRKNKGGKRVKELLSPQVMKVLERAENSNLEGRGEKKEYEGLSTSRVKG